MKFGIHSPSYIYPEANIFDAVKQKAIWIEQHGFDWFSVMVLTTLGGMVWLFWIAKLTGTPAFA